ncbi:Ras-related protein Rab-3B, partial [Clonorchis sinensis]
ERAFSCSTLSVSSCHATQRKHESWDTARFPKPRQEKSRGSGRVLITDLPDTAGQERYRTITTAYYRGAMGFILMYDITNEESFNAVQDWVTQIKTYSWDNAQVVLVGNKCDLAEERAVSVDWGRRLAQQLGLEFFEASAKEDVNVRNVFERLVDLIFDKMADNPDSNPAIAGVTQKVTVFPLVGVLKTCQSFTPVHMIDPAARRDTVRIRLLLPLQLRMTT